MDDVRITLQACIATGTKNNYERYINHLIIFLFDYATHFPEVIKPDLMGKVIIAHDADLHHRTRSSQPFKCHPQIWDAIKTAFENIHQNNESTHSLYQGKLSFHMTAFLWKCTYCKNLTSQSLVMIL